MAIQTVTHAVEADAEPARFFNVLAQVENIPRWAPVFADSVEHIRDSRYRLRKNGEAFEMEVFTNASACTVDYLREMPNGKRGGAYIRVTPRPLGGSSITMTVPIAANTTEADVAKVLSRELAELSRLAQA
jgi:hypothetical protein